MFKQIAVAAALVIASLSAFAQQPAPKFYVGGEISSSEIEDVRDTGFGGFAGYNFNEYVGIEVGFNRLMDKSEEGAKLTADQTSISVIGTLPLGNGFSVFGRAGYNEVKSEFKYDGETIIEGKDTGAVYGVGMAYAITPAISARVEVAKPFSNLTKLSAGVSFGF